MAKSKKEATKTASVEKKSEIIEKENIVLDKKSVEKKNNKPLKGFFKKKYDSSENILTIFKRPATYAALLGEALGMTLLTAVLVTLGVDNPIFLLFGVFAITLAVYGFSGANLNPTVTAGMMATRRMSVIRGVLYILAQLFGAWMGYLLAAAFVAKTGNSEAGGATLKTMAAIENKSINLIILVEFLGAIITGFFFARALAFKKTPAIFAAIVASGIMLNILLMLLLSSFAGLRNNFVLNPAVAIMYQILPSSGNNFGEIMKDVMVALSTYFIFPMIGGVIGFYLADLGSKLAAEVND